MSRALRRLSRNQEAKKALLELSSAIPLLQSHIKGIAGALPTAPDDTQKLLAALVEDCETLARENAILRETFLRLLMMLGDDTDQNIRKVEAEIRASLLKEHEGT